ncbi:MAG TPA: prolyl oligopeptidase family serine peptidase [Acidobacteriota bacterium]|nr:prolyl oligopeptidase family serine peptidase [Acidobacteriota bacterium]
MNTLRKLRLPMLWLVVTSVAASGQSTLCEEALPGTDTLSDSPTLISDPVQFLEQAPAIDGVLDNDLSHLTVRGFTRTIRHEFDGPIPEVSYRLAYGTDFLYAYVEAQADSLTYRDRAYQNGDGFHMVLAVPRPDNEPTEEFYVLACSAVGDARMEWSRRLFWYYNVDDIFIRLSEDAKLEFNDGDGVISFELLLPWHDVHPYHPWISEDIGFNLRFVKATEPDGKVEYDVVHDDCIGCELHPRSYALLEFAEPAVTGAPQTFVVTDRGHITEGDSLAVTAVTVKGWSGEDTVVVLVRAGEGDLVTYESAMYPLDPVRTMHAFGVDTRRLPSGGYTIEWQSRTNDAEGETGLTILPPLDPESVGARLQALTADISPRNLTTMEFLLTEITAQIDSARLYETCTPQRIRLARLQRDIETAIGGRDPYAGQTGFLRRAYRSVIDSSLQPYMVWLPDDFDADRRYPLLVYLHGSASTEYDLRGSQRVIPEGFIALAPRGRGTSNCFTFDQAQEDIAEALAAVVADYPIDTTAILLTGFSMGGYGVYRTFYESPEKFRALAVFSGSPNMANEWYPGNAYPDFTDPNLLGAFRDIPVFVFHGQRDRNVSHEATEAFMTLLRQTGARVEFHPEADKGHEAPSDETYEAYHEWVRRITEASADR